MITYDHITSNKQKTILLIGIFLVLITAIGWVFSLAYNSPIILAVAVAFSIISALTSYYFSTDITLAISQAKEVDRQSNQELYRLVENLCIAGGLPVPKIYIINDTALNAFATGRDPEHAVIVFTTGIIERLDRTELEGVTAHELSHIGNYDIRVMTIVVILVGLIALLADFFLRMSFFGRRSEREGGNLQAIMMVVGIVLALLSPVIATMLQLAVSRSREYLADASGALLTRYPEGLASALEKLSADHEPLEAANKATAHLYIVNPLKDHQGKDAIGWFAGLFNTHPPLEDRIKRLRGMNIAS